MTEPPTCVPSAAGTMRAATAAAEPEDDPPGVRALVEGIGGGPRMRAAEFGRDGLAEHHRAGLAQRPDGGVVALREVPAIGRAAHLRGHVARLEQVLDADAACRRWPRAAGRRASARAGIGRRARAGLVRHHPGPHHGLARGDRFEAAFEIGARRIGALGEGRGRIVEGEGAGILRGWAVMAVPAVFAGIQRPSRGHVQARRPSDRDEAPRSLWRSDPNFAAI